MFPSGYPQFGLPRFFATQFPLSSRISRTPVYSGFRDQKRLGFQSLVTRHWPEGPDAGANSPLDSIRRAIHSARNHAKVFPMVVDVFQPQLMLHPQLRLTAKAKHPAIIGQCDRARSLRFHLDVDHQLQLPPDDLMTLLRKDIKHRSTARGKSTVVT